MPSSLRRSCDVIKGTSMEELQLRAWNHFLRSTQPTRNLLPSWNLNHLHNSYALLMYASSLFEGMTPYPKRHYSLTSINRMTISLWQKKLTSAFLNILVLNRPIAKQIFSFSPCLILCTFSLILHYHNRPAMAFSCCLLHCW